MSLAALLLLLFTANLLTFGNGRVMVPILERALVEDSHALTLDQFLYAFTLGRVTPGPANLYVSSIGYLTHGWLGAALAVVVVVLPAYLVLPLHAGYRRLEGSPSVRGFGRGLTAASVGLIAASTVDIGQSTLTTPIAAIVCALTAAFLYLLRWNTLVSLAVACVAGVGLVRVLGA